MRVLKNKAAVIGFFAFNTTYSGGQEIKTRSVYSYLCSKYTEEKVIAVDSLNWKKRPLRFFQNVVSGILNSENIVICPAQRGIKILGILVALLRKRKKQKIFYAVVGGWLPGMLKRNGALRRTLKRFDRIFVETSKMQSQLTMLGFNNVSLLRNAKQINPIKLNDISQPHNPVRVCTFSRITEKKGIKDAIDAVNWANKTSERTLFSLTLFGQIEPEYEKDFQKLMKNQSSQVVYGGLIEPNKSVSVLKDFDILVFPTHFYTEGFPGTLIDAFASGLAVLASEIPSTEELITTGKQGFLFQVGQKEEIANLLLFLYRNPNKLFEIKKNSRSSFDDFSFEKVYSSLDAWIF